MSDKIIKYESFKETYKNSELQPKLLVIKLIIPTLLFILSITKTQYVKFSVKFSDPHCLTERLTEFRINSLIHTHAQISKKSNTDIYTMRDSIINCLKCNYGNKRLRDEKNLNTNNKTNASVNNKFTENYNKLGDKIPESKKHENDKVKDNTNIKEKVETKEKIYNIDKPTLNVYNSENNTNYNNYNEKPWKRVMKKHKNTKKTNKIEQFYKKTIKLANQRTKNIIKSLNKEKIIIQKKTIMKKSRPTKETKIYIH